MSLAHVAFYSIAACLVCKWLLYHCKWKFSIDNIPWSTTLRVKITSPRNNPAKGEEVFIAVMGVTGSGKSTFIRQVTGDLSCGAGHSLESATVEVREYRCHHKGKTYVLIDTPGFDDSYRSNDEIVESILDWLEKSYRARKLLSGIIYLHRISDVKMQGSSLENLRMFRKLCGFEAMKHVLLVTTFWDRVTDAQGKQRVQELSSNNEFWGRMIQRGSKIKQLSKGSCDADVKEILGAVVPSARCALQAQIEIVDQGKQKNETDVARDTLKATQLRMSRQLEQEKKRSKKRLERQQREASQQHQLELERLRESAAQERQIKEDARLAAEMMEDILTEMQNYTAKQQLREQIQQQQEEGRRATARLEQERAKTHAQLQQYISSRCYHGDAEERRRCNHCGVKLHKERTHYYHCCHCSDMYSHRNYNQCSSCGLVCRVSGHPAMVRKVTVDYESCILM